MIPHGETWILRPLAELSYFDARAILLPAAISPLEAWRLMTEKPLPLLGAAFRIRDAVSARFGVKRIGGFSGAPRDAVQVGDHLDFFLVEHVGPEALVLTERDRHLDVMACLSVEGPKLTVTASVVAHNAFGRAYMLPVGPAHKLIVGAMLRRLKRRMARGS